MFVLSLEWLMSPSTLRCVLPIFEGDQLEAGTIFSILKDPVQDGGEGDMWMVRHIRTEPERGSKAT